MVPGQTAGGSMNACCRRADGEQERGKTQRFNAPADHYQGTAAGLLPATKAGVTGRHWTGQFTFLAGPDCTPIPSNEVGRGMCWAFLDAKPRTRRRACTPWPPPLRTRARSCTAIEEITSAQELEVGGFKAQCRLEEKLSMQHCCHYQTPPKHRLVAPLGSSGPGPLLGSDATIPTLIPSFLDQGPGPGSTWLPARCCTCCSRPSPNLGLSHACPTRILLALKDIGTLLGPLPAGRYQTRKRPTAEAGTTTTPGLSPTRRCCLLHSSTNSNRASPTSGPPPHGDGQAR
jgi:hypothetical protein